MTISVDCSVSLLVDTATASFAASAGLDSHSRPVAFSVSLKAVVAGSSSKRSASFSSARGFASPS